MRWTQSSGEEVDNDETLALGESDSDLVYFLNQSIELLHIVQTPDIVEISGTSKLTILKNIMDNLGEESLAMSSNHAQELQVIDGIAQWAVRSSKHKDPFKFLDEETSHHESLCNEYSGYLLPRAIAYNGFMIHRASPKREDGFQLDKKITFCARVGNKQEHEAYWRNEPTHGFVSTHSNNIGRCNSILARSEICPVKCIDDMQSLQRLHRSVQLRDDAWRLLDRIRMDGIRSDEEDHEVIDSWQSCKTNKKVKAIEWDPLRVAIKELMSTNGRFGRAADALNSLLDEVSQELAHAGVSSVSPDKCTIDVYLSDQPLDHWQLDAVRHIGADRPTAISLRYATCPRTPTRLERDKR